MPDAVHLIDREISWLSFNERVLELAEDESIPLLERVRFLTIFASNLDEFYMVRVASVLGKIETNPNLVNSAGYTPSELIEAISVRVRELTQRHAKLFKKKIAPELKLHDIEIIHWDDLSDD
jgi:polyphosphate kinase